MDTGCHETLFVIPLKWHGMAWHKKQQWSILNFYRKSFVVVVAYCQYIRIMLWCYVISWSSNVTKCLSKYFSSLTNWWLRVMIWFNTQRCLGFYTVLEVFDCRVEREKFVTVIASLELGISSVTVMPNFI